MLKVEGLTVRYGLHRALLPADLSVAKGEIVVILGSNGAGKSSLLRAIAGICRGVVAGRRWIGDRDLSEAPARAVVEAGVAFVPEGRGIFGELSVADNLALGATPVRALHDRTKRLAEIHSLFPVLSTRAGQIVRTMSGGEQQMVAIGRAMMSNPDILMLDEPSLGLSPLLTGNLFAALKQIRAAGLGILLVEQNARQSLKIADRGYLIENGRLSETRTASDLMGDPAVQRAYLGAA